MTIQLPQSFSERSTPLNRHGGMSNTPKPTIITRNGQTVHCYGEWKEDSNCSCVFDDEELDDIYCDGGANWTAVVEELTAYATREGTELVELVAC
jgi:hypothetical protein